MDARGLVEEDIKQFINKSLKSGILQNPRISGDFFKRRNQISSKHSRFADEEDYKASYYQKYEEGEYIAALKDGSFFQVNYEFHVRSKNISHLEKMSLCYLPNVVEGEMLNEYIRADFDNCESNSFFHSYAHLHVGFKNSIRIPIDEVLLFSEFCKMILYYYYPDDFAKVFSGMHTLTNTKDTSSEGKLTKNKVISKELEKYFFIKTVQ